MRKYALSILIAPASPVCAGDPTGSGLTLAEAHAVFVERYHARTQDGHWHTLSDDGYIHTHLTWHLEKAGQEAGIHALLCEETAGGRNGWFEACERRGRVEDFLADLARAWRLVDLRSSDRPSPIALEFQCRYALITASLNSLARNIPPDLLVLQR
jgi:hypothetical protein